MSSNPRPADAQALKRSRYPGVGPFTPSAIDVARYFGRGAEADDLFVRVLRTPLVVLFGPSGGGRTSLLHASLLPRLRDAAFLPVLVRLDTAGESLTDVLGGAIRNACTAPRTYQVEGQAAARGEMISTVTVPVDGAALRLVLFVDRFEDVFTAHEHGVRRGLASEIEGLVAGLPPVHVRSESAAASSLLDVKIVVSIRQDYLPALHDLMCRIPASAADWLSLPPMTADGAREAIVGPARLPSPDDGGLFWSSPFDVAPSALDSLIEYVCGPTGTIEPFLLQLIGRHAEAIAHLKSVDTATPVTLTPDDFAGANACASILGRHYRNALAAVPDAQRRRATALCEEGLLDRSRRRVTLDAEQIRDAFGIDDETLAILSEQRLLRSAAYRGRTIYEISHDRLAEAIAASRRIRLPPALRRALPFAAAAALIVAIASIWSYRSLTAERGRAESAQRQAQRLLDFLLGDGFMGELRAIGRSDLLDQVRRGAGGQAGNGGAALSRALDLRNNGDVARARGSSALASAAFRRALDELQRAPEGVDRTRATAIAHDRLAEVLRDRGDTLTSLAEQRAAIGSWRQLVGAAPAVTPADCIALADGLTAFAELQFYAGDTAAAVSAIDEVTAIAHAMLFGSSGSPAPCGQAASLDPYPDASVLTMLSGALSLRNQFFPGTTEEYEGAATLTERAVWLEPSSGVTRHRAATALAWRGSSQAMPERALADHRKVLADTAQLRRWDAQNRLRERDHAASQLLVAGSIVACRASAGGACAMPSLEEAEGLALDATAALRALVAVDPQNLLWVRSLADALETYASVLAQQGRMPERLTMLDEAIDVHRATMSGMHDTRPVLRLTTMLENRADALIASRNLVDAGTTLGEATALLASLTGAQRNVPDVAFHESAVRRLSATLLRERNDGPGAATADVEAKSLLDSYVKMALALRERIRPTLLAAECAPEAATPRSEALTWVAIYGRCVSEAGRRLKEGDHAGALRQFAAAESAALALLRYRPASPLNYEFLRLTSLGLDQVHAGLRNTDERVAALARAASSAQMAAWLDGGVNASYDRSLRIVRGRLGTFLFDTFSDERHLRQALAIVEAEVVVADSLARSSPDDAPYQYGLGNAQYGVGLLRRRLRQEGWEEAVRGGLVHMQRAARIDGRNPFYARVVADMRRFLARALEETGDSAAAVAEYRQALDAYRETVRRNPVDQVARDAIRDLASAANR